MITDIMRHNQSQKIIEELLDIALTTLNTGSIPPTEGEQLAKFFLNSTLHTSEGIRLLLKIDMSSEPIKTLQILKKYGINEGT